MTSTTALGQDGGWDNNWTVVSRLSTSAVPSEESLGPQAMATTCRPQVLVFVVFSVVMHHLHFRKRVNSSGIHVKSKVPGTSMFLGSQKPPKTPAVTSSMSPEPVLDGWINKVSFIRDNMNDFEASAQGRSCSPFQLDRCHWRFHPPWFVSSFSWTCVPTVGP